MKTITTTGLGDLFEALSRRGFTLIGPTVRDQTIVYDEITSPSDLPIGWTDEQDGGTYRLEQRADQARFGFNVGPTSWKRFLYPPRHRLWEARRTDDGFDVRANGSDDDKRYAFIGARPCELSAVSIHDRVFSTGDYEDPVYRARRENAFFVAVNCTEAGNTCFCASMNTGPAARSGYDIALTEVIDDQGHYFVVDVAGDRGEDVLADVPSEDATPQQNSRASELVKRAAAGMGRKMETAGLPEMLLSNYNNPRWEEIGKRCLSCGNCTQVCPTCFCSDLEDTTSLAGDSVERWRRWDSCFTMGFSYIHGGSIRSTPESRYRQWLTHKLANWIDQFDTSGCVGCGRCITWCPVGIDLTEEVRNIRSSALTAI